MAAQRTQEESIAEAVSQALDKAIERNRAGVDPLVDLDLEVGMTPKDLVHSNGTLKLHHYRPTCDEVYRVPLIVIPSLVSRSYILDLAKGQSLVEFLLEKGFDVYLLDWGTPRPEHSGLRLADYVLRLMPEWLLLIAVLGLLSMLGVFWSPLLIALPLFATAMVLPLIQAIRSSSKARFPASAGRVRLVGLRALVSMMHAIQPIGRLSGRIRHGLTIWRRRGLTKFGSPIAHDWELWSEGWKSQTSWLEMIEDRLRVLKVPSSRADAYSRWDIEVRGGIFGATPVAIDVAAIHSDIHAGEKPPPSSELITEVGRTML